MTALRDIVVVLDNSAPSETRLATAIALAQQPGAYLTGLSALDLWTPPRPVVQSRRTPEGGHAACIYVDELGCGAAT